MTQIDGLISSAELGEEARLFIESALGRCLLGMAQQQVELAREALETVDPIDLDGIRKLQNDAKLGRQFEEWLYELLTDGEQAMAVFKQQEGT
jgi:hypothetical protein